MTPTQRKNAAILRRAAAITKRLRRKPGPPFVSPGHGGFVAPRLRVGETERRIISFAAAHEHFKRQLAAYDALPAKERIKLAYKGDPYTLATLGKARKGQCPPWIVINLTGSTKF